MSQMKLYYNLRTIKEFLSYGTADLLATTYSTNVRYEIAVV